MEWQESAIYSYFSVNFIANYIVFTSIEIHSNNNSHNMKYCEKENNNICRAYIETILHKNLLKMERQSKISSFILHSVLDGRSELSLRTKYS